MSETQQVERMARAIYAAAFDPQSEEEAARKRPSPGWCWERTSEQMREFARKQARAALFALTSNVEGE